MEERVNKTVMCSVLFLDIVEYSKKSVSGQIALKEAFNVYLSAAIGDVPINDRIILDTGDGAAISFLGDVEDALKAALILRERLLSDGVRMEPPLLMRMGVNLGPVRLVKDINGLPNIVGDGINVAQRVMEFSDPGQILVSRSYYDAVTRLPQDYAGMFHYDGLRTDKHVREHEVYAIGYPGEFTATHQHLALGARRKTAIELFLDRVLVQGKSYSQLARTTFHNASAPQRALYLSALAVLLIVLAVKVAHRPAPPAPPVAVAPVQPAVEQAAIAPPKMAEPIVEQKAKTAMQEQAVNKFSRTRTLEETTAVASVQPAVEQAAIAPPKMAEPIVEQKAKTAMQEQAVNKFSRTRTLEETTAVNTGEPALVSVTVTPWGEVYLDGRMQGVSPPLAELRVTPGRHEIEIRNTTFPVYRQSFQVEAGGKIVIKHKFSN